jgi:hypothetical protein
MMGWIKRLFSGESARERDKKPRHAMPDGPPLSDVDLVLAQSEAIERLRTQSHMTDCVQGKTP